LDFGAALIRDWAIKETTCAAAALFLCACVFFVTLRVRHKENKIKITIRFLCVQTQIFETKQKGADESFDWCACRACVSKQDEAM
jgi:hypothetical protein